MRVLKYGGANAYGYVLIIYAYACIHAYMRAFVYVYVHIYVFITPYSIMLSRPIFLSSINTNNNYSISTNKTNINPQRK